MTAQPKLPLAFVDEYGQANLDVSIPDVGTHFVLTAVLVDKADVGDVRAAVDAVRAKHVQTGELRSKKLAKNLDRFRRVLEDLAPIPFRFYAYSGLSRSLVPVRPDHSFRSDPITDSGAPDHPFRRTRSAIPG